MMQHTPISCPGPLSVTDEKGINQKVNTNLDMSTRETGDLLA